MIDIDGSEVAFALDSKAVGVVTINGQDVSNKIEGVHIHLTPGFSPIVTLRILGFEFEAKASLIEGTLKWPKDS